MAVAGSSAGTPEAPAEPCPEGSFVALAPATGTLAVRALGLVTKECLAVEKEAGECLTCGFEVKPWVCFGGAVVVAAGAAAAGFVDPGSVDFAGFESGNSPPTVTFFEASAGAFAGYTGSWRTLEEYSD